jgi:quercetin dioxygenase-like cupin family protein
MDRQRWLAERRATAEESYTLEAPSYDDGYDPVTPVNRRFVTRLIDTCPSNGIELDAACGTGPYIGMADFTFGPNSSTGWHSHPGKTLVTVQSGAFTVYHDDCHAHTYVAGDAFVELPSSVHVGRNETSGTVELGVVFFGVPIAGSPRIDQPQPDGCDVA